jgi:hypothetical protein
VERANLFPGVARAEDDLQLLIEQTLLHATVDLVVRGGREVGKGRYYLGAPLEWATLDYDRREQVIRAVIKQRWSKTEQ